MASADIVEGKQDESRVDDIAANGHPIQADASGRELFPRLVMRRLSVGLHGCFVFINLAQGKEVGFVEGLGDLKTKAARLLAGRLGVLSHDGKEFINPRRVDLEYNSDGYHARD